MKTKKILSILLSICMIVSGLPFAAVISANAAGISYIDENRNSKTYSDSYTTVTSTTTTWSDGWYVVGSSTTINSRVTVSGTVYLILQDGYTLNAAKGIKVISGNTLVIYGQSGNTGTLTAAGTQYCPGIGGCDPDNSTYSYETQGTGTITINGGTINATGGSDGAGIGGGCPYNSYGDYSDGGYLTIHGGIINATGGSNAAGIGGGHYGSSGELTINGGYINASCGTSGEYDIGTGRDGGSSILCIYGGYFTLSGKGSSGKGIGSSAKIYGGYFVVGNTSSGTVYNTSVYNLNYVVIDNPYEETSSTYPYVVAASSDVLTATFDANGGSVSPASKTVLSGELYGSLPTPTREGAYAFDGWYTAASGGTLVTAETEVTATSNHTLYAHWVVPHLAVTTSDGAYTYSSDDYVLNITSSGSYTVTMNTADSVTSTTRDRIKVTSSDPVEITVVDLNITSSSASPIEIDGSGEVTLILSGDNTLTSSASGCAGLQNASGSSLTISDSSTGALTATGGSNAAGIGGGAVTVSGGTINAVGSGSGSGIDGSAVSITAGVVNASSSGSGSGIGSSSASVKISGGYIKASSDSGDPISGSSAEITGGCFEVGDTDADTVYGVSVASGYAVGKNADADTKGTYPYTVAAKGTQYTVTFEVTDGTVVGDSSITVEFDSAYGTLPTANLNNSTFVCWCTEDGTEITSTSTVVIAGDHTLYASGQCNHKAFDSEGFCLCGEYYQPADWNSTEGYYEIGNVGQFLWFESLVNGDSSHSEFTSDDTSRGASANAVLTADIDMSSYSSLFTPMGRVGSLYNTISSTSSITSYGYTGTFDGQGHTISNLTISTVSAYDIGIFATLGGTVKNLGIISFKYTQSSGDVRGGAIAGQILPGGTVENCYVQSSTVTCTGGVGGVLARGNFGGTIKNCYVVSSSVSASRKGYLVGDNVNDNGATVFKGTITNCYTDNSSNVGKTGGVSENVTQKTSAVFASGEVAYLLQNGQSDTSALAWGQNLDTDSYPVLTLTDETLRVLKLEFDLDGSTVSTAYVNNGSVCDSYPEPSDHYVYTFYTDSACTDEIADTASYTFDYTASNSITVYVKQGGETYNVTFVIDNASVNSGISTYEYGVGADLPTADDITCDQGYAFVGWYTSADYSSSAVTSIGTSEYGDKTYYARIISSAQTVTFDANGGAVSPSTATVTYGEEYGTLPTPTRTDYAFGGWFTEADGGDLVTSDTVVTTTGDHTLYAH
ncbi:MAG: InlB B-repeat-containing protein [Clostridiales bacterium]|nr:InlB B-repeat-containing protein [Clostridiales bacterium]